MEGNPGIILNHPLNYDFGFKMFALFQGVSGGKNDASTSIAQMSLQYCIYIYIYIYEMYFLCDVYL